MKYLLCTIEYPPQIGGVSAYYANLVKSWGNESPIEVLKRDELMGRGPLPWIRAVFSLIKAIRRHNYDLVFIGQILPLGTVAILASLFRPFRFAVFLHGMDLPFALHTARKRWLSKLILNQARAIICANTRVKEILLDSMPETEKKIIILNPGATQGRADVAIKDQLIDRYNLKGKKVLLSLGRLVERKGFDQAIKAFLEANHADSVYLIAGEGPIRESLEKFVVENDAADRIFFLGSVSEAEKWSLLDLCDIFITVSREIGGDFEGFGIVYLEANLMAKPVIAGRSGGVADAVADGESGILVSPENTREIAAAISSLFSSEEYARKLGSGGKARAEKHFSWQGQADRLKSAIEKYI